MNLLSQDLPIAVVEINNELMFDIDCDGTHDNVYPIATSNRTVIDIMQTYEGYDFTPQEKTMYMLRVFYLDNIPRDLDQAAKLAMRFMDCDEPHTAPSAKAAKLGRLWSFTQDGNMIYAGINQSFDNILKTDPDLHWYEFMNCMWNMRDDCRFNEVVSNRAAHKLGKATKEQKQAAIDYPGIYILNKVWEAPTASSAQIDKLKQFEAMLNS